MPTLRFSISALLAALLGALMLASLGPWLYFEHFLWSVEFMGVGFELWLILSWPWRKRRAGRVVARFEVQRPQAMTFIALGGAVLGVIVVVTSVDAATIDRQGLLAALVFLIGAVVLVVHVRMGRRITENGLLTFDRLVSWESAPDVKWTTQAGFMIAEPRSARPLAWAVPLLAALVGITWLHAWLLPGGYEFADGVRVRAEASKSGSFRPWRFTVLRAPGDADLFLVLERRGSGDQATVIASIALESVRRGDEIEVDIVLQDGRTPNDIMRRLQVRHHGESTEEAIPRPFRNLNLVVYPLVLPADWDGAFVLGYAPSDGVEIEGVGFVDLDRDALAEVLVVRFTSGAGSS